MKEAPLIRSGGVLVYRLFDVAWEIDLVKVEATLTESRRFRIDRKLFSKAFEFKNPPVSIALQGFTLELGGTSRQVRPYAKFYNFGVLSIIYDIPVENVSMETLESLALELRSAAPLTERAQQECASLMKGLAAAMTYPTLSSMEEDYTIYYIRSTEPRVTADELLLTFGPGRLMLQEEGEPPPGARVLRELLENRFSYSNEDMVLLSYDNALVVEPSMSMDIPDLLEFATAQLLELMVYDQLLDRELDSIYERIRPGVRRPIWKLKRYEALAAKVMRTVTELTEITEKVDNSLKVTEDVYYARVYSNAISLFRVKIWDAAVRRKIDIASRVYDMLYREISNKRIELLEVVIVLLIAIEIVIFLFLE